MFDITRASRIIKEARIKKNLTQSALADLMGVTYQAVSNWERGNSLPDISKLEDLCRILNLDLYALIGVEPVRQSGEAVENVDISNAPSDSMVALAPFIPPEELMGLVRKSKSDYMNMPCILQLAPFIDGELTEELCAGIQPNHIGEVVSLLPFVSTETCAALIEKMENFDAFDLDVGLLSALGPYLPQGKMDKLAEKVIPESLTVLTSVAPFVSSAALGVMANQIETISLDDYLIGAECLAPFLGKETMKSLYIRVVK